MGISIQIVCWAVLPTSYYYYTCLLAGWLREQERCFEQVDCQQVINPHDQLGFFIPNRFVVCEQEKGLYTPFQRRMDLYSYELGIAITNSSNVRRCQFKIYTCTIYTISFQYTKEMACLHDYWLRMGLNLLLHINCTPVKQRHSAHVSIYLSAYLSIHRNAPCN